MRELPTPTLTIYTGETRRLILQYIILVDETPEGLERYGAKITETETGDKVLVRDLTTSVKTISALIKMLEVNSVTPTGLMDVLADWL